MSRAILSFDLPEEAEAFEAATHAQEWREVVDALTKHLRDRIKYGKHSAKTQAALQDAFDLVFAEANARGLEVWQ